MDESIKKHAEYWLAKYLAIPEVNAAGTRNEQEYQEKLGWFYSALYELVVLAEPIMQAIVRYE